MGNQGYGSLLGYLLDHPSIKFTSVAQPHAAKTGLLLLKQA